MRVAVVVCGANGERAAIIEKAVEKYSKKYFDRTLQFSACTVAASPIILEMSGVEAAHTVAVNGCRNKCSEILMKRAGMGPRVSVVLDDVVGRDLGKCGSCASFVFPEVREDEWNKLAEVMGKAVEDAS